MRRKRSSITGCDLLGPGLGCFIINKLHRMKYLRISFCGKKINDAEKA